MNNVTDGAESREKSTVDDAARLLEEIALCSSVAGKFELLQNFVRNEREAGRRDALEEQWISVVDDLPKVIETVLFKRVDSDEDTEIGWRVGDHWIDLTDTYDDEPYQVPTNQVVCWMRIPEPKAAAIRALET